MAAMRVSVALGTHQGARFVAEQVRSILAQTRPVDELVVSDDASTDGTLDLVHAEFDAARAAGQAVPDLVVMRNDPPLRVTQNFAQALARTTGEVVALCDQDDVWHPDRVATLLHTFADPSALLVFSNARQVDAAGAPLGHSLFEALAIAPGEWSLVNSGQFYRQFLRRNLATGATVMLRRELVTLAQPFPDTWLHDEWLAMIAAAHDGVRISTAELTDYRQHGANQVGMDKLGVRRKLRMFAEPRTERNLRLYQRAAVLPDRLRQLDRVPLQYVHMSDEKLAFETARQAYPRVRIARALPIARQLRLGRYSVYGTGLKDAVRNLLQPV